MLAPDDTSSEVLSLAAEAYLIDLHIHTSRYSPCAPTLDPHDVAAMLTARQLHGGVLSEHDFLWPADHIAELQSPETHVRLYRGMEISCATGHILAIGLEDTKGIFPGIDLDRLIALASEQQAALICVHPYLRYRGLPYSAEHLRVRSGIHAVETISSVTTGVHSLQAAALATGNGWAQAGGSDAHAIEVVGSAATVFSHLPDDEQALAAMIIKGQCRALATCYPSPHRCS